MSSAASTALPDQPLVRERTRIRTTGPDLQRAGTTPLPSATSTTTPHPPERRSSGLSFISEDRRHSVTSTANDFILPSVGDSFETDPDEPSHWHSTPLAFAFLPAVGGLFFSNGSAFVTDILLLGLAAIFLNWSVRLPWDWYHRAQTTVSLPRSRSNSSSSERNEAQTKAARDAAMSKLEGESTAAIDDDDDDEHDDDRAQPKTANAAARLRTHELFALSSTFVFPVLAAYLLHIIRGQLSRPSTGLVSDYNLTIFLLAAEIRPVRHLIRLVTNRTVHLQRVVNSESPSRATALQNADMTSRIEQLEAKLSEQIASSTSSPGTAAKDELTALSNELRKRYEPRIDALERALRRYEKRVTTLTILTEQRLQNLQSKLDDALSLAAVAAQSSQKQGLVIGVFTWCTLAVRNAVQGALGLFMAPIALVSDVSHRTSVVLFGPGSGSGPGPGRAVAGIKKDGEGRRRKTDKSERSERSEKVDRERMRRVKE